VGTNLVALSSKEQVILITLAALLAQTLGGGSAAPDIVLSTGHGANISALAFSPDGKYLVSASEDATLKLWNPATGGEIRTLRGHSNIVTSIALNVDGTEIASASLDHTLRVWNAATGESIAVLHGPQPTVYLLKMTPDSNSLITAETVAAGTILRFWDIKTGKQTRLIKRDDAAVSQIFFSGRAMFVAEESGEDDATGALTTYDWQTGKQLQTRHEVLCGVSENGKWLAIDRSTATARKAVIVDLAKDKPYATLSGQVSRVMFSNNGEWLAYESSTGDTAVVRKTAGGSAQTIHGRGAEFSMLALSPDGKWLATAGADYSLHIWDVETGKLAHGVSGQYTPSVVAFSADGRRVAVNGGGTDLGSALQVWDIDRKAQVSAPRIKKSIVGLAFGRNGEYLAVSTSSVDVFDVRSGGLVSELNCVSGAAVSPVFSPSGRFLAANCGGVITLWSVAGGGEIFHFGAASDTNTGPVVFSPDAKYLAASSSAGVTIYDIQGRKPMQSVATSDPVTALAFSPNSDLLAFGIRLRAPKPDVLVPSLFLFDLRTHREVQSIFAGQWVSALKFERDGRTLLAATGEDLHKAGSLTLFETATGKPLRRLSVRVPSSSAPVISANGEWIGLGWNSGTSLWRLSRR
jgi:WD40 repeat protein